MKINTFKAFHFRPVEKKKRERKPGSADMILSEHEGKGHADEEEDGGRQWRGAVMGRLHSFSSIYTGE